MLAETVKTLSPKEANAYDAIRAMQDQYLSLTQQRVKLMKLMQAGAQLPCAIMRAFNEAVAVYRAAGIELFRQLEAKNIKVQQIVYGADGEPERDPNDPSKVKVLTISVPLHPGSFVADDRCPNIAAKLPQLKGFGAVPVAIPALIAVGRAIGPQLMRLLLVGTAGYFTVQGLRELRLAWHGDSAQETVKVIDKFTSCVDQLIAQGVEAAEAVKRCPGAKKTSTFAKALMVVGILGVAALGTYAIWRWRASGAAAALPPMDGDDDADEGQEGDIEYIPPE